MLCYLETRTTYANKFQYNNDDLGSQVHSVRQLSTNEWDFDFLCKSDQCVGFFGLNST